VLSRTDFFRDISESNSLQTAKAASGTVGNMDLVGRKNYDMQEAIIVGWIAFVK
jgi:hypothetical protein